MVSGRAPAWGNNSGRWDFFGGGGANSVMAGPGSRNPQQRNGSRNFPQQGFDMDPLPNRRRGGIIAGQPDIILGNPSSRGQATQGSRTMQDDPNRYRNQGILGGVSVPQATSALTSGQPSFEQWKASRGGGRGRSQGALPFSHGRNVGAGPAPVYRGPGGEIIQSDASGAPSFSQWKATGFRRPDDNQRQSNFGHWVPLYGKNSARPGGRGADQGPFVDPATVPGTKPYFLAQAKKKKWPPQDKMDGQRRGAAPGVSGMIRGSENAGVPDGTGKRQYEEWKRRQGKGGGQGGAQGGGSQGGVSGFIGGGGGGAQGGGLQPHHRSHGRFFPGFGFGGAPAGGAQGGQGGGRQSMGWRAPTAEQRARLGTLADKVLW